MKQTPDGQQVLHRDMNHERGHTKEHMEVPIDTSNMSEQELQFHYFKMHDADGNNKLDGCELVKSLIHWHGEIEKEKKGKSNELLYLTVFILCLLSSYPISLFFLLTDEANHDHNSGQPVPEAKIFADDELVNMIDPILASDDKNRDGFIDYPEFVQAQQAAQAKAQV